MIDVSQYKLDSPSPPRALWPNERVEFPRAGIYYYAQASPDAFGAAQAKIVPAADFLDPQVAEFFLRAAQEHQKLIDENKDLHGRIDQVTARVIPIIEQLIHNLEIEASVATNEAQTALATLKQVLQVSP